MRKIISYIFIILALAASSSSYATAAKRKIKLRNLTQFNNIDFKPTDVFLDEDSLNEQKILRTYYRGTDLVKGEKFPLHLKAELYVIRGGNKKILKIFNKNLKRRKSAKNVIFKSRVLLVEDNETIYLDLFDTNNRPYGTYSYDVDLVDANFLNESPAETDLDSITAASCSEGLSDPECLLEFFVQNINFSASYDKRLITEVSRDAQGSYNVILPIKKGRRIKKKVGKFKVKGSGDDSVDLDNGYYPFFDTDELEIGAIRYDTTNGISFGVNDITNAFTILNNGGIAIPPMPLQNPLYDGAFEYDGSDLYFTANGDRINITGTLRDLLNGDLLAVDLSNGGYLNGVIQFADSSHLNEANLNGHTLFTNNSIAQFNGVINIPTGALNGLVLTSDINGNASWRALQSINNGTIFNGTLINSYFQDPTINGRAFFTNNSRAQFNGSILANSSSQFNGQVTINNGALFTNNSTTQINGQLIIPTGANAGFVLITDANGLTSWSSPLVTLVNGDDLGNHTAIMPLNMNFLAVNNIGAINYPVGATNNFILATDGAGNATWQNLDTLSSNITSLSGVNLQDPRINGFALFTNNSTAQFNGNINIPAGAANGLVLTSDNNGNVAWRAIPSSADNLGSHIAGANLNLNGFSLINAQDINGITANFINGNFSTIVNSPLFNGGVFNGGAANITNGNFTNLTTTTLTLSDLNAANGNFTNIVNSPLFNGGVFNGGQANITDINANTVNSNLVSSPVVNGTIANFTNGNFTNLTTTTLTLSDLNAANGNFTNIVNSPLFNGGVFNGGAANITTINANTVNSNLVSSPVVNGTIANFTNGNFTNLTTTTLTLSDLNAANGNFTNIVNSPLFNGGVFNGGAANITTINTTTINAANINGGIFTGTLQGPTINGRAFFTDNSIAHFNGQIIITNGATTGFVLTSDANGNATWQAVPSSADNLGSHIAGQNLNLNGFSLINAQDINGITANFINGNFSSIVNSPLFNGGVFNGGAANITTINTTTINAANINGGIFTGTLQDPTINGRAFFTNNSIAHFNGQIIITNGATTGLVLTSDANGNATWQAITTINNGTINNGTLLSAYLQDPTINGNAFFTNNSRSQFNGTIAIPAGSANGLVLTSDANGNAAWRAIPSSADNLGSHIAGQNLNLNGFSLINAQDINGITANFANGNFNTINIANNLRYSNGAAAGLFLTSDANGNASWQAVTSINNGTINNASILSSTLQDPTINGFAFFTPNSTTQFNGAIAIPAGSANGLVLTSDANGNATWRVIPSSADNLGSHIAEQNLSLNGFSLINAQDINGITANFANGNFNTINIANNLRYSNGAAAGLFLISDANGNASWQAIASINNGTINNATILSSTLQDPTINGFAFFTPNSTAQFNGSINIPAGAANGLILTSDANGNATWRTLPSSADNLGNHIAGQNLNLNGFSLINAQDINGITANFVNGNFTTINATNFNGGTFTGTLQDPIINGTAFFTNNSIAHFNGQIIITNGATTGFVLTSDANGNATWQASALDNLGNHTADMDLDLNGFSLVNGANLNAITLNVDNVNAANGTFTNIVNSPLFNGGVFNGAAANINGTITTAVINGLIANFTNGNFTNVVTTTLTTGTLTATNFSAANGSFTNIVNSPLFNGGVFNGGAANINGTVTALTVNGTDANFTELTSINGSFTTINASNINGGTFTGTLQDPIINGLALFTNNSFARFNGTIHIPTGATNGFILTANANGIATWQANMGADNLGNHNADQNLNLNGFSLVNGAILNAVTLNVDNVNAANGTFTNIVNSPLFNGGVFNGGAANINGTITALTINGTDANFTELTSTNGTFSLVQSTLFNGGTFNGVEANFINGNFTNLTAGSLNLGFTPGSVIFADINGALAENNGSFHWDDANGRLGLGTNTPLGLLDLQSGTNNGSYFTVSGATGDTNWLSKKTFGDINIDPNGNLNLGTGNTDGVDIGRATSISPINIYSNGLTATALDQRFGLGTGTPQSLLDVGGGSPTYIDGTNDALVADDLEVDGDVYINGTTLFNSNSFTRFNGTVHIPAGATNGFVLTADANGIATWAAATGTDNLGNHNADQNLNLNGFSLVNGAILNAVTLNVDNVNAANGTFTNIVNSPLFNGGVFNGGAANINGTVTALTINGTDANFTELTSTNGSFSLVQSTLFNGGTFNGVEANFTNGNFTNVVTTTLTTGTLTTTNFSAANGSFTNIVNSPLFNGGVFNGGAANINGTITALTFNGTDANFTELTSTNGSFTTINATNINGGTFTGTLQDPIINGLALFTNNSFARFNGTVHIPAGATNGFVLTADANGIATWQVNVGVDNLGNHNAEQNLNLNGFSLVNGVNLNAITLNVDNVNAANGSFTNIVNSPLFNGGVFNGGAANITGTITTAVINGVEANFTNGNFTNVITTTLTTGTLTTTNLNAANGSFTNIVNSPLFNGGVFNGGAANINGTVTALTVNGTDANFIELNSTNGTFTNTVLAATFNGTTFNGAFANFRNGTFLNLSTTNFTLTNLNAANGTFTNIVNSPLFNGGVFNGGAANITGTITTAVINGVEANFTDINATNIINSPLFNGGVFNGGAINVTTANASNGNFTNIVNAPLFNGGVFNGGAINVTEVNSTNGTFANTVFADTFNGTTFNGAFANFRNGTFLNLSTTNFSLTNLNAANGTFTNIVNSPLFNGGVFNGGAANITGTITTAVINGVEANFTDVNATNIINSPLFNGGVFNGGAINVTTANASNGNFTNIVNAPLFNGGVFNGGAINVTEVNSTNGTFANTVFADTFNGTTFNGAFANFRNGTFLNLSTTNFTLTNLNAANGTFTNIVNSPLFNGGVFNGGAANITGTITTAVINGVEANFTDINATNIINSPLFNGGVFNGGAINVTTANASNGNFTNIVNAPLFNGGVFNGGAINVTEVNSTNGTFANTVLADTFNGTTFNGAFANFRNGTFLNLSTTNFSLTNLNAANGTFTNIVNSPLFNGGVFNGGAANITGTITTAVINGVEANFTDINATNIINSPLFNGGVFNGGAANITTVNANIVNAPLFNGGVFNGGAINVTEVNSTNGTFANTVLADTFNGTTFNGAFANFRNGSFLNLSTTNFTLTNLNAANGTFTNIVNSPLFNGGVFNGGAANITGTITTAVINGVEANFTDINATNIINSPLFNGGVFNGGAVNVTTVNATNIINSPLFNGGVFNGGAINVTEVNSTNGTFTDTVIADTFNGAFANFRNGSFLNLSTTNFTLTNLNAANGTFTNIVNSPLFNGGVFNGGAANITGTITTAVINGVEANFTDINATNIINSPLFNGGVFNGGAVNVTTVNATNIINSPLFNGGVFNGGAINVTEVNSTNGTFTDTVIADTFNGAFANFRNGTFLNLSTTNFTLTNLNAANGTFTNIVNSPLFNGGVFNGGAANITGTITTAVINGAEANFTDINATNIINSPLFNGGVFNGGAANITNTLTAAVVNGVEANFTNLNSGNGSFTHINSVDGTFTSIINSPLFNGGVFNGGAANITGTITALTVNATEANFTDITATNGNFTTINATNINGGTFTGTLQDPIINGTALFSNNSFARFNGTIQITPGANDSFILTSDANGVATWVDPTTLPNNGDDMGNHTANQGLTMSGFSITNIDQANGNTANFTDFNGGNGNFTHISAVDGTYTSIVNSPLFNGGVFNGGAANITGTITTAVINGIEANFTGTITAAVFNGVDANFSNTITTAVINGVEANFTDINATNIINSPLFNGGVFNGGAANITNTLTAAVVNGVEANFTNGNFTNLTTTTLTLTNLNAANGSFTNIVNSPLFNGGVFNGGAANITNTLTAAVVNGVDANFSNTIIAAVVNGVDANFSNTITTAVINGVEANFTSTITAAVFNGVDANFSNTITTAVINGVEANFTDINATNIINSPLFNGGVFNGGAANITNTLTAAVVNGVEANFTNGNFTNVTTTTLTLSNLNAANGTFTNIVNAPLFNGGVFNGGEANITNGNFTNVNIGTSLDNGNLTIVSSNQNEHGIVIDGSGGEYSILRGDENGSGTPDSDNFRISFDDDFGGGTSDYLVIDKTDGNSADPDGGIVFTMTGNDNSRATALRLYGNLNAQMPGAVLDVGQDVRHNGDTDTYIRFTGDDVNFVAGGEALLDLHEDGTQDIVTLGDGGDVDINFNNDMFLEGSSGEFGIGTTTPAAELHVVGSGLIETDLGINTGPNAPATELDVRGEITTNGFIMQDGAVDQYVLTTDGNGFAYWAEVTITGNGLTANAAGTIEGAIQFRDSSGNLAADETTFFWDRNNERLGINMNTPSYNLDVSGTARIRDDQYLGQYLWHEGDTDTNWRFQPDEITIEAGNERMIWMNEAGSDFIKLGDNGDIDINLNDDLFVDAGNNRVGILTTTPSQTLDVVGSAQITGDLHLGQFLYHDGDTNTSLRLQGDDVEIRAGNELMIDVHEDGTQDFVMLGDGGDVDVNLNNDLYVQASSSRVGIGITTPQSELDVRGDITTNGLTMNNGATLGFVLTTDATGRASWADLSSLASNGDDLGNHTATQALAMAGFSITNADQVNGNTANFTTANTTTINTTNINTTGFGLFDTGSTIQMNGTINIPTGASNNFILRSDATGNATWVDPNTIPANGDNLGNHTATQALAMAGFSITNTDQVNGNTANFTTANTTTINTTNINTTGFGLFDTGSTIQMNGTINIPTGASNNFVLRSDATGNATWVDPNTIPANGDNLGNHTATQALAMAGFSITNADQVNGNTANFTTANTTNINTTNITTTGFGLFDTGSTIQMNGTVNIPTGAALDRVLRSDATGNATWVDITSLASNGDNLGDHTATQALAMAGFSITNADQVNGNTANFTTANTTTINTTNINTTGFGLFDTGSTIQMNGTVNIPTGASNNFVLRSDATGNATWVDPTTLPANGDNLGNHTATQALAMAGFSVTNADQVNGNTANFTTANTTTINTTNINTTGFGLFDTGSTIQMNGTVNIPTGASNNFVLRSDATGNATWVDPTTLPANGDDLGNHTATQALAMAGFSLTNADQVNGNTANFTTANTTTINTTNINTTGFGLFDTGSTIQMNGTVNIPTGASNNFVLRSDATGNATWVDPTTLPANGDDLGNHTATQALAMAGFSLTNADQVNGNTANFTTANTTTINTTNINTTGFGLFDTGSTIQMNGTVNIPTGASNNFILRSDATGNATWVDPTTLPANGDDLGNHTATQALAMAGFSLTNADQVNGNTANFTTANTTTINTTNINTTGFGLFDTGSTIQMNGTVNIPTGAAVDRVLRSDATGNATWVDITTLPSNGDDLGNHTATQALAMAGFSITNADQVNGNTANFTTANTTTINTTNINTTGFGLFDTGSTIQMNGTVNIPTGASNNFVLRSDATGNATWVDPTTIPANGDNLGNHTATQALAMAGFSLTNADQVNGNTANFTTGNITTVNSTDVDTTNTEVTGFGLFDTGSTIQINGTLNIPTGAGADRLLESNATGDASWVLPSTVSVGNADTLDSLDATDLLRSNANDNYSSGTLTFDSGTEINTASGSTTDIDGDLEVADTNISLNGASTTLTQTTGDITLAPANNSDLNVDLSGTGIMDVDSDLTVASVVRSVPTDSPGTCNAGMEGGMYYDASMNEPCFCDGSNWVQFDGGGNCT